MKFSQADRWFIDDAARRGKWRFGRYRLDNVAGGILVWDEFCDLEIARCRSRPATPHSNAPPAAR
jgi:hypothetical protein